MESNDDALVLTLALREALGNYRAVQDARSWATPRTGEVPDPPWPTASNPMLDFVIRCGAEYAKDDAREGLVYVAVHAWMEGHVEGYDRAMRDV